MKNHMSYYHLKKKAMVVTGFMNNTIRTCVAIEHATALGRLVIALGRSTNSLVDSYFEQGLLDPKFRPNVINLNSITIEKLGKLIRSIY